MVLSAFAIAMLAASTESALADFNDARLPKDSASAASSACTARVARIATLAHPLRVWDGPLPYTCWRKSHRATAPAKSSFSVVGGDRVEVTSPPTRYMPGLVDPPNSRHRWRYVRVTVLSGRAKGRIGWVAADARGREPNSPLVPALDYLTIPAACYYYRGMEYELNKEGRADDSSDFEGWSSHSSDFEDCGHTESGKLSFFKAWARASCEPDFKRLCHSTGCFFSCLRQHWPKEGNTTLQTKNSVSESCRIAVTQLKDRLGLEFLHGNSRPRKREFEKKKEDRKENGQDLPAAGFASTRKPSCAPSTETALTQQLRSPVATVVSSAMDSLWDCWFHAEGGTAYEQLRLGNSLMNVGPSSYEPAGDLFRQLIAEYPTWVEAKNRLATLLWLEGKYEKSFKLCHQVLAANPTHFGALSGCWMVAERLGRHQEADHLAYGLRAICPACATATSGSVISAAANNNDIKNSSTPHKMQHAAQHVFYPSSTATAMPEPLYKPLALSLAPSPGPANDNMFMNSKDIVQTVMVFKLHLRGSQAGAMHATAGAKNAKLYSQLPHTTQLCRLERRAVVILVGVALGLIGTLLLFVSFFTISTEIVEVPTKQNCTYGNSNCGVEMQGKGWLLESWTSSGGWLLGTNRTEYEQPLLSAAIHTFQHLDRKQGQTESITSAMQKQCSGYGSACTSPAISPVASPKAVRTDSAGSLFSNAATAGVTVEV